MPAPQATDLFETRQADGKGLGIFAKSNIKRGTLLIREAPLIIVGDGCPHSHILEAYSFLCSKEQLEYDRLHRDEKRHDDYKQKCRSVLLATATQFLSPEHIDEWSVKQAEIINTFHSNEFRFKASSGNDVAAVYHIASRLNHSCVPNTHRSHNPNLEALTVYANRDIEADEELTVCYPGSSLAFLTQAERAPEIKRLGFECKCDACNQDVDRSDHNRREMQIAFKALGEYPGDDRTDVASTSANGGDALKQAEKIVDHLLFERLHGPELIKGYRWASQFALSAGQLHKAFEYAINEMEVERNIFGLYVRDLDHSDCSASRWLEDVFRIIGSKAGRDVEEEYRDQYKRLKARIHKYKWICKMRGKKTDSNGAPALSVSDSVTDKVVSGPAVASASKAEFAASHRF